MSSLLWSGGASYSEARSSRRRRLVSAERVNQITHGVAAVLAAVGGVVLCLEAAKTNNLRLGIGCGIYGASLFLVYFMSTLSHSYLRGRRKHTYRTLDQIAIFMLMAGNYTPIGLTVSNDGGWWMVLAAMWLCATIGIAAKLFVTRIQNVPVGFYAALGLMPVLAYRPVVDWFSTAGVLWVVAGGVCYSLGTYFLVNDTRYRYYHAIWHVLVMAGSTCHFIVIYSYLVPGLS